VLSDLFLSFGLRVVLGSEIETGFIKWCLNEQKNAALVAQDPMSRGMAGMATAASAGTAAPAGVRSAGITLALRKPMNGNGFDDG
jgi:hypothetical protein